MTPVALWTGRLPGLRPLPRRRTLWLVAGFIAAGAAGAFGGLGPDGPWLAALASVAVGWSAWRHRWPTELPARLRSPEPPQGSDEKAVLVEFRRDGVLIGWDVGILWFERGGVGFVGRTVSFVLPRALMAPAPPLPILRTVLRAPQLSAKVFETTVGFVPLAPELRAEMTLARIEALPDAITSETVLPPSTLHPDLLQRATAVRRRGSFLIGCYVANVALTLGPNALRDLGAALPRGIPGSIAMLTGFVAILYALVFGASLPNPIRERLPK